MELYCHCLQRIVGFKWVFIVTVCGELLFWNGTLIITVRRNLLVSSGTLLSQFVEDCWFEMELYFHCSWRIVGLKSSFVVTVENCWFEMELYCHGL
jgi:hypothetical protein